MLTHQRKSRPRAVAPSPTELSYRIPRSTGLTPKRYCSSYPRLSCFSFSIKILLLPSRNDQIESRKYKSYFHLLAIVQEHFLSIITTPSHSSHSSFLTRYLFLAKAKGFFTMSQTSRNSSSTGSSGEHDREKSMEGALSTQADGQETSEEMTFPEGGARAWFVAAGAAGVMFCTLGYVNSFG